MIISSTWNIGGRPALLYGRKASEILEALLQRFGWRNTGLVYSKSAAQAAQHTSLFSTLEELCEATFQAPSAHMPMDECMNLAMSIAADEVDGMIVLGGGSAIDAVKVAQVVLGLKLQSMDELEAQAASGLVLGPPFAPPFETIAIPTTLSAAEHGSLAGVTSLRTKTKHVIKTPLLDARAVILDADLAMQTPRELWIASGMRAIDHAIEGYLSKQATPFTDGFAEIGLKKLASGLRETSGRHDGLNSRETAQFGAWFAGSLIGEVTFGASHAMGHQLGAMFGVSHGHTSSILLPAVLNFNAGANPDKERQISHWLGYPEVNAGDAVRELVDEIGLPSTLSSVGVGPSERQRLAEACHHANVLADNPREATGLDAIQAILRLAA